MEKGDHSCEPARAAMEAHPAASSRSAPSPPTSSAKVRLHRFPALPLPCPVAAQRWRRPARLLEEKSKQSGG
jgi:hypothetical protein